MSAVFTVGALCTSAYKCIQCGHCAQVYTCGRFRWSRDIHYVMMIVGSAPVSRVVLRAGVMVPDGGVLNRACC